MSDILLIENDFQTVQSLHQFFEVLGLETLVVQNWPSRVKPANIAKIKLIFANVELPSVHINKLFQEFDQGSKDSIPVFYIYSRTFDPRYVKAQEYQYAAAIKKPIQLMEVFSILEKYITVKAKPVHKLDYKEYLASCNNFVDDFESWINKLNMILGKNES